MPHPPGGRELGLTPSGARLQNQTPPLCAPLNGPPARPAAGRAVCHRPPSALLLFKKKKNKSPTPTAAFLPARGGSGRGCTQSQNRPPISSRRMHQRPELCPPLLSGTLPMSVRSKKLPGDAKSFPDYRGSWTGSNSWWVGSPCVGQSSGWVTSDGGRRGKVTARFAEQRRTKAVGQSW